MKYRIIYRRSLSDEVEGNILRGDVPGEEKMYLWDDMLCEWTVAILEGKPDKGGPYTIIGNVIKYKRDYGENIVRVVTEDEVVDFFESQLSNMFNQGKDWSQRSTFGKVTKINVTK